MRRDARWAAVLLGLGLAVRAGYAVHVYRVRPVISSRAVLSDPDSYDLMARNLLDRGQLTVTDRPSAEREPLYPLVLALAHALLGRSFAVGVALNMIFGLWTCWLVYRLAWLLWADLLAARLSLALACLYPEWVYYDGYMFREPLMTLLLAGWAWLWFDRERLGSTRAFAGMGALFGALSLVKAALLPIGAAFLALAAWRLPARSWLKALGPFLVCAAFCQAPWIARNYKVAGRFVPGASMGGCMMYLSLLKDYSRPDVALEAPMVSPTDAVLRAIAAQGLTTSQAEPLCYQASWAMLRRRPLVFWGAFLHKCAKMWRLYPNEGYLYGHSYALLKVVGLASNGGLLLLGFAGMIMAWRRGRSLDFLLVVPPLMTVVYGFYWAVSRFHSPFMVSWLVPAGLAAAALARRAGARASS